MLLQTVETTEVEKVQLKATKEAVLLKAKQVARADRSPCLMDNADDCDLPELEDSDPPA